jgi:undecaprenyl-diphosphatase
MVGGSLAYPFLLGAIQGISEFAPISSTAHLFLLPWLFGVGDPGLAFSLFLHLGTLGSLLIFFRSDILRLLSGFFRGMIRGEPLRDPDGRLAWLIILASFPGAGIGYLVEGMAERSFRNPVLIASAMISFGFVMLWADISGKKRDRIEEIGFLKAFGIGLFQALAVIPGISRSGATMSAALFLGLSREESARFSFLLSIPIIAGAGLFEFLKVIEKGVNGGPFALLVGFFSSFVFGYLCIRYLLSHLRRRTFKPFVWYRLIIGSTMLILWFIRGS